ncbi:MAG: GDP-fucose synthetase [Gammaproteobacteria bacterium]|nr:GDP-fucose synthetase [Gammaproteobacteria bacterium]
MSGGPKIYVAGHSGMVGSAIVRALQARSQKNIVTRSRKELDLTNQQSVHQFFDDEKPDQVYMAAAKVGGIHANDTFPADFIYENLIIEANVIAAAFQNKVKKLLFLGSSCIYPRESTQPIPEDALLSGALEPTNEPYAIAKIAGIKLCESFNRQYGESHGIDYRSVMPTNLYGPGDTYGSKNSHVIPALISRFHEAKIKRESIVDVWGTGEPRREFLHVDDMADASVFVMNLAREEYIESTSAMCAHINVGSGVDVSIKELAALIAHIVGYSGNINFDTAMPDGMPRKLMDSGLLGGFGWSSSIPLEAGLKNAYEDFCSYVQG